jgi:hypothetical protein
MRPTKSVPGGCVIGLLGVGSWIYAALCGFVLWRLWQKGQVETRQELFQQMGWQGAIAAVMGLLCVIIGWRIAMRTGDYDHWDPNQPRAKF